MIPCVMDASVGVKLVLDEDGSEDVAALVEFSIVHPDARLLAVPDLFFAECTNIVLKAIRTGELDAEVVLADLRCLTTYGFACTPTAELLERAASLARQHMVSGYDAFYVALAERLRRPLVTADQHLLGGTAARNLAIISLADYMNMARLTGAS